MQISTILSVASASVSSPDAFGTWHRNRSRAVEMVPAALFLWEPSVSADWLAETFARLADRTSFLTLQASILGPKRALGLRLYWPLGQEACVWRLSCSRGALEWEGDGGTAAVSRAVAEFLNPSPIRLGSFWMLLARLRAFYRTFNRGPGRVRPKEIYPTQEPRT